MNPKCDVGQKVVIRPASNQPDPPRDCAIASYAGQIGEVTRYYWLSPRAGEVFYLYTVRVGTGYDEIALYEDEIEVYTQ
ncbi:hypothetical protein ACFLV4_04235 [Chloroflexota bacterium]